MPVSRRQAIGCLLAASATGLTPVRLLASSGAATRLFEIDRAGSVIGTHSTTVRAAGEGVLDVAVEVRIAVKILGITAYRYEMDSEERWTEGRLDRLVSSTNDDGTRETADVTREAERLVSRGTWTGEIDAATAATTTYWAPEFLERPAWLSTQTGRPFAVAPRRDGSETIPALGGEVSAARWRNEGDLPLTLYYDARGEWLGNAFDAGGEEARFRAVSESGALAPLWTTA